jgi:hypothetical protein
MAYSQIPTRSSTDPNASADINQLQDNIDIISPESSTLATNRTILDTDSDNTIFFTTGSGSTRTITLPAAANNIDREITVLKVDAGTTAGLISGTINGLSNYALYRQWAGVTLKSNGTDWYSIRNIGINLFDDTDSTIRSQATPVAGTWYQPSGSNLEITVTPGVYVLRCNFIIENNITGVGQGAMQAQLDTDTVTPGGFLIDTLYQAGAMIVGANITQSISMQIITNPTQFNTSTTIRPSVRVINWASTPTFGTLYMRNDVGVAKISAERVG